ncbi:MAG: hypothetical protein ACREQC_07855, partial [Candidatus Binataceae bacterium]
KGLLAAFAASILVGALSSAAIAQNSPVTNFDYGYLNEHPEIAQRLAGSPALVDNSQFMANHPGLREYFANHPEVRSEIRHHPYRFMAAEDQLNNWNGRYWPSNWTGDFHPYPVGGWNSYSNASWRFDHGYLSEHPEVAQQLSENPALGDNPNFMASHPGLQEYLENHPQVRADLRQHPYMFMSREDQQNGWREPYNPNTSHPLANTDRYLDQHPEVTQQLNQNPRLIDNPQYVESHPGLDGFLATHPYARQEWKSHPYRYENRENRYNQTH